MLPTYLRNTAYRTIDAATHQDLMALVDRMRRDARPRSDFPSGNPQLRMAATALRDIVAEANQEK